MRVSYASGYYAPIPDSHIFPMRKFEGLHRHLLECGIVNASDVVTPSTAHTATLGLVHTPRYLDAILNGTLSAKEQRRLGLPWTPGLALRSQLAVQGTLNAAIMALHDGISGNLAGGTHHAMPDHGEGFCVFNDVAIACRWLLRSARVERILILDCDVHQGNGTAAILSQEPGVFTFSLHGQKNYPFHKPPSSLDVGLEDRTGDAEYLRALEQALGDIGARFRPQLVFYLGGIDPLEQDHFGRLCLSLDGLRRREEAVIRWVGEMGVPLVLLLSGGYSPTLRETVLAHAVMFDIAKQLAPFYY